MRKYWVALIMLCSGCAGVVSPQEAKSRQMLDDGIRKYENGNYREAVAGLQGALDAGLSGAGEKVKAHKFLAFTYCVSNREALCREEFAKLLAIDPKFELAPAEAGHPMWGNVFRSAKRNLK